MAYPGGKSGAGVYQMLINRMPPHEVYIEPFLGGGAILRQKRPARLNIGLDLDEVVIREWLASTAENDDTAGGTARSGEARPHFRFEERCGIAFLQSYPFTGRELVYCDPPYMHEGIDKLRSGAGCYRGAVSPNPYRRHRFPPEIIAHAVWLYYRFPLSFRDIEEMLAARGIIVSYEAVRLWCTKFGPGFADERRRVRKPVGRQWFLDEVFVRIGGVQHYLWRAVDQQGVVVDILVQARRDRAAAERFFRHLLRSSGGVPRTVTTDRLASYRAALPRVLPEGH